MSIAVAEYIFFTQLRVASVHLAISMVLVGCTASAFDAIPHGMAIPGMTTVFVVRDEDQARMQGLLIACIHLLYSFIDYKIDEGRQTAQCALVRWLLPASDQCNPGTGMRTVKPKGMRMHRPVQVIPLKSVARGAHLLPKYSVGILPDYITHANALDEFQTLNPYIDHHCHRFLSE